MFFYLTRSENMDKGKSQTWFYFAGKEAEEYEIDYVAKQDEDTLPYLDEYLDFVDNSLPPYPYNSRTLAGLFVNKVTSWELWKKERKSSEDFFWNNYNSIHVYAEGSNYILSTDLCAMVAKVGSKGLGVAAGGYEDHDVSVMAFMGLDKYPIRLVPIPKLKYNHCTYIWKHGIKIKRLGWSRMQSFFESEINRAKDPSVPHYVDPYSPEELRKAKLKRDKEKR